MLRVGALAIDGHEFQDRFHWHVEHLEIGYIHIKPRAPRLDGKGEPSHLTDHYEFYQLLTYTDDVALNQKLQIWEDYHNFNRPHGSLGGKHRTRCSERNYPLDNKCLRKDNVSYQPLVHFFGRGHYTRLRRIPIGIEFPQSLWSINIAGCAMTEFLESNWFNKWDEIVQDEKSTCLSYYHHFSGVGIIICIDAAEIDAGSR